MSSPLLDLKFVVLSGKGGVGRTTVAATMARAAAAAGKRVLIAQADAIERLGSMLGRPGPVGSTVTRMAPLIDAVNMTPRESLHEYALLILKYETVYRALFANRAVRGFLSAIPGLDAYAMLGKAWWHTTETEPRVETKDKDRNKVGGGDPPSRKLGPKYDLVILDGPASGHAVAMLKIPKAIIDAAPAGPLVKDARALRDLLADPSRAALVIVTRPEELPCRETRELAQLVRSELGIPLGPVIVNAMPPSRLSDGPAARVLDRLPPVTGDVALDTTLNIAASVRAHRRTAERVIADLAADPGLPLILLPWLPSPDLAPREIDQLSAALVQGLEPAGPRRVTGGR
jgi:anion-transporting  ArsA/GET3 family ATPase